MAAIITVKLSIDHDHHSSQQPHILAYTDNSSAMGWMYHSTFNPVTDAEHDSTARYLANLLLQAEATLYPEHIPGVHNEIADSLSRDFHLNDSQLLHLLYHSQDTAPKLPPKLNLHQPSKTVISWIVSKLESIPRTKLLPTKPAPSTTAASFSSKSSSHGATSTTHSWTLTTQTNSPSSCVALPTASGPTTTEPRQKSDWQAAQSPPPSQMWFRPSGKLFGLTPLLTAQEPNQSS